MFAEYGRYTLRLGSVDLTDSQNRATGAFGSSCMSANLREPRGSSGLTRKTGKGGVATLLRNDQQNRGSSTPILAGCLRGPGQRSLHYCPVNIASAGASARNCAVSMKYTKPTAMKPRKINPIKVLNQAIATRHTTASTSAMNGTNG